MIQLIIKEARLTLESLPYLDDESRLAKELLALMQNLKSQTHTNTPEKEEVAQIGVLDAIEDECDRWEKCGKAYRGDEPNEV